MANELETDLLRTFVAIADAGGFTRAAQRIHRTQSAVSMQMKRLEENIGRALFQREGRQVVLTHEGEMLLSYARRILKLQEEALTTLTAPDLAGLIRVGTPDDYVLRFLPGVLSRFAHAYPQVQVEVHCEPSTRLEAAIASDELDLALITREPQLPQDRILRQEPAVWATSARHFVHEREPLPLALFQKGCIFRQWAMAALDRLGRPYRVAYVSPSLAGIQAVVSAGLAVTVLGRSILPAGVRELTPEEGFPGFPSATIILRRSANARSRASDCLAAYLADGFSAELPTPLVA